MKQNSVNRLLVSILLAGLLCAGLYLSLDSTVNVTIALSYDNIDKGLSPDDSKFNYRDMVSEEVLKEVYALAEVPYEAADAEAFNVVASMPASILETIENKLVQGESYSYYPNQYTISIKTSLFGLNRSKAKKLAAAYFEGYKQYFYQHYKYPFASLAEVTGLFTTDTYDYPEMSKVLERKLNILRSYYQVFQKEDSQFVSQNGLTFNQVLKAIDLAKDVDLRRISSLVNTYQLTKDKDKLTKMYEFMIKRYQNDQNKVASEYALTKELLEILKSRESNLVLPGVNGEPITVKALDDSYDSIAKKATEAIVNSSKRTENIAYYENERLKLVENTVEASVQIKAIKEVQTMSADLEAKVQQWAETLNTMSDEYFNQKYLNTLTQIGTVQTASILSKKVLLILAFVLTAAIYTHLTQMSRKPRFPKRERRLQG